MTLLSSSCMPRGLNLPLSVLVFEESVKLTSQFHFSSLDSVVWILLACEPLEAGVAWMGVHQVFRTLNYFSPLHSALLMLHALGARCSPNSFKIPGIRCYYFYIHVTFLLMLHALGT